MGTALLPSSPHPLLSCSTKGWKRRRFGGPRANLHAKNDDDPLLQVAIGAAAFRFHETHRPDPLFVDPYAGCFIPLSHDANTKQSAVLTTSPYHYCLATRFIDDKLLSTANHLDGVRQIVLFTDGMDTRPYRLKWPHSTIIFDISPERIFKIASERLEGVGAKISRTSMLIHVPWESNDIQEILQKKGFSGNRPSIWALQGLPVMTLASFKKILFTISSLAMKGSSFFGEMPWWLADTAVGTKEWMEKLYMSNGFMVGVISYDEVARNVCRELPLGEYRNILFMAEQLQLSDNQMENWRREFQRMEEEGDEEGFEEL